MGAYKIKLPVKQLKQQAGNTFAAPATVRQRQTRTRFAAVALAEIVAATAILAIGAVGALGYQYYAVGQARVAHAQITATRIGQLMLEDWKSTGGSDEYDPTMLGFGFESITVPQYLSQRVGRDLGDCLRNRAYAVTINNVPLTMVLRWQDIETDSAAQMTLRQLSTVVKFDEPKNSSGSLAFYDPAIILTTYVRVDGSGG